MRLISLLFILSALSGCGLMPEKSYAVPDSSVVLRYPALWTVSQNVDRYGLLTVFSPDAKPGPRSTRITVQAGNITAEPRPGSGVTVTAPILGRNRDTDYVQRHDYILKGTVSPENLHGCILYQDLGVGPEGLHGYRIIVPPVWAIEAYAPPRDFATIRSTAERMAKALSVTAAPGAITPGVITPEPKK